MTTRGVDKDYWFLRENGVSALTALKMVGMVYTDNKERDESVSSLEENRLR